MDRNLMLHTKIRIVKGGSQISICLNCHMTMYSGQSMHNRYDCEKALQETLDEMRRLISYD